MGIAITIQTILLVIIKIGDVVSSFTNKQKGMGIKRIFKATICSYYGFRAAWTHEPAFRQDLIMAIILIPLTFLLADFANHGLLSFGLIMFVLFAEIVNSALEALADSVTLEHHALNG
ncbi:MAG: diacylglycerol kinase (ATP) [Glaciecola sp.]|jgi:diacylglycerol kinase (ATP)